VNPSLDVWIAAGPWPQRAAMRALLALAVRPRGAALLRRLGPVGQLTGSMVAMGRFDDPDRSAALGWDPRTVVARAGELRAAEGPPG
jgi:hypothetical protein